MSIIRIKKEKEYVSIANAILQNKTLTWEARGIMAYLLSKPDGWECRNYDLVNQGPAGRHIVQRILKELQEAGYIHRYQKSDGHKIEWITEIYETPELNTTSRNTDIPQAGEPTGGKVGHIVSTDSSKYLSLENTDLSPSAENKIRSQSSGDFGDSAKGDEPIIKDALTETFGPNPRPPQQAPQSQANGSPKLAEAEAAHLRTFGHLPTDKLPKAFDTIQEIKNAGWEIWNSTVERTAAFCIEAIRTKKPNFDIPKNGNVRKDWHKDLAGHLKDYKADDLGTLYVLAVEKLEKAGMSYTRPGSLTRTLPDVVNEPTQKTVVDKDGGFYV